MQNPFLNHQFSMKIQPFKPNRVIYSIGSHVPNDFYPKENYLVRAILYRRTKHMNTFVLVTGKPRTSKSAFCLKECERLCELSNKQFDVYNQITLEDMKPFFKWSKTAFQSEYIFDEVSTQLSTDQFWTNISSIFRVYTNTQGFRENVIFLVLPFSRTLQRFFKYSADFGIKTLSQGKVAVYQSVVDTLNDQKPYFKPKHITISFGLPKEYIWMPYTEIKKEWNDNRIDSDINLIDNISIINEQKAKNMLLRQRSLELSVALKQDRMDKINNPPKKDDWLNVYV